MKKFRTITFEVDLMFDDDTFEGLDKVNNKIITKFNTYVRRVVNRFNFTRKKKIIIRRITNKTFPIN